MGKLSKMRTNLLNMSSNKDWSDAKTEWKLDYVYKAKVKTHCLCGSYPLQKLYVMKNTNTGLIIKVGASCAKHIIKDYDVDKIFPALKALNANKIYKLHSLVDMFYFKGLLSETDKHFYHDMRQFSVKKEYINPNQKYKLNHMIKTITNIVNDLVEQYDLIKQ